MGKMPWLWCKPIQDKCARRSPCLREERDEGIHMDLESVGGGVDWGERDRDGESVFARVCSCLSLLSLSLNSVESE